MQHMYMKACNHWWQVPRLMVDFLLTYHRTTPVKSSVKWYRAPRLYYWRMPKGWMITARWEHK